MITAPQNIAEDKYSINTISFANDVEAKNKLMLQYSSQNMVLTEDEASFRDERVERILADSDLSRDEKDALLEMDSIVIFDCSDTNIRTAASSSSDVQINKPIIAYDYGTDEWILQGSGYWKNSSYESEIGTFWWYPDKHAPRKNGFEYDDYVGISLKDTEGYTSGVTLNSSSAKFYNGSYSTSSSTRNFTSNSDYNGYEIALSDYIYITDYKNYVLWIEYEYYWVP
jgi:hypothetical protein